MPKFNVHLYREMRLYYPGITATDAEEAVRVADLKSTREAHHIEDCDAATIAALVDPEGDTDYDHSRLIDLDPKQSAIATLLTALAGLVEAIRAGHAHNEALATAEAAIASFRPAPTGSDATASSPLAT